MHALWCSRTLGRRPRIQVSNLSRWRLSIPAGKDSAAAFVVAATSSAAAPKPIAAPVREPREMVMEGGDKKFYLGKHRNETYSEVAKQIEFIQWLMAQSDLSMQNLAWFNR